MKVGAASGCYWKSRLLRPQEGARVLRVSLNNRRRGHRTYRESGDGSPSPGLLLLPWRHLIESLLRSQRASTTAGSRCFQMTILRVAARFECNPIAESTGSPRKAVLRIESHWTALPCPKRECSVTPPTNTRTTNVLFSLTLVTVASPVQEDSLCPPPPAPSILSRTAATTLFFASGSSSPRNAPSVRGRGRPPRPSPLPTSPTIPIATSAPAMPAPAASTIPPTPASSPSTTTSPPCSPTSNPLTSLRNHLHC